MLKIGEIHAENLRNTKKMGFVPTPSNISAQDSSKWSEPFHNRIFAGGGLAKFLPLVADGHNNIWWDSVETL